MSKSNDNHCKIVSGDESGICLAANALQRGELAAFPTETVYGLGASAWDSDAVKRIFEVKGRPYSDPLIVHVSDLEMAFLLCELSFSEKAVFEVLAQRFWPGPLTLVVPASAKVSRTVTAGGDTVGIRCPAHPIALELIAKSGLPLAAPSANRFGHVSPTTAEHVAKDLGQHDLVIIDGGSSAVGIESTVLKIQRNGDCVVLRRGAVSAVMVAQALAEAGLSNQVSTRNRFVKESVMQESPGELLIHYAPVLPTYLLSQDSNGNGAYREVSLEKCALVDLGGRNRFFRDWCGHYVDLSESGKMEEVCERLFSVLREVEQHENIECILVPDLGREASELALAVADRLNRAAALKKARIVKKSVQVDV